MRKKYRTRFFASIFFIAAFLPQMAVSQDKGELGVGTDFVSRYVWRGMDLTGAPSIQPWVSYDIKGFSFMTWGAYSANDANYQEIDLVASYTLREMVSFTVSDYFATDNTNSDAKFFDYDADSTNHYLEGSVAFLGTEKLPIRASANYMFYGADNDYSWYFELGYFGEIQKYEYDLFMGATPAKGMYLPEDKSGFAFVNIGGTVSRSFQITEKFEIPFFTTLAVNPASEKVFLVAGLSLTFID